MDEPSTPELATPPKQLSLKSPLLYAVLLFVFLGAGFALGVAYSDADSGSQETVQNGVSNEGQDGTTKSSRVFTNVARPLGFDQLIETSISFPANFEAIIYEGDLNARNGVPSDVYIDAFNDLMLRVLYSSVNSDTRDPFTGSFPLADNSLYVSDLTYWQEVEETDEFAQYQTVEEKATFIDGLKEAVATRSCENGEYIESTDGPFAGCYELRLAGQGYYTPRTVVWMIAEIEGRTFYFSTSYQIFDAEYPTASKDPQSSQQAIANGPYDDTLQLQNQFLEVIKSLSIKTKPLP